MYITSDSNIKSIFITPSYLLSIATHHIDSKPERVKEISFLLLLLHPGICLLLSGLSMVTTLILDLVKIHWIQWKLFRENSIRIRRKK